jgi:hypothetical protein
MASEEQFNEFPFGPDGADSDTHRRVCAQCMRPRSATEIAYAFNQLDPNVAPAARHRDGVAGYLGDLEAKGLVKNLGPIDDPAKILDAQDKDKELIDFQGQRDAFVKRAQHPLRFPFPELGEDHYVMTKAAHAKLTGQAPSSAAPAGPAVLTSALDFAKQERNGNAN